jgi:hypothetical protein
MNNSFTPFHLSPFNERLPGRVSNSELLDERYYPKPTRSLDNEVHAAWTHSTMAKLYYANSTDHGDTWDIMGLTTGNSVMDPFIASNMGAFHMTCWIRGLDAYYQSKSQWLNEHSSPGEIYINQF